MIEGSSKLEDWKEGEWLEKEVRKFTKMVRWRGARGAKKRRELKLSVRKKRKFKERC